MTEDRAAIYRSGTTRNERMTDISSKGLLPQLIDVLDALAEGQKLLSRRIRDAQLDYARESVPAVDGYAQPESADIASLRSSVAASSQASIGGRREATENRDSGAGGTRVNDQGNGSSPEPSIGTPATTLNVIVADSAQFSNPQTTAVSQVDKQADPLSNTTVRAEWANSARTDDEPGEPLNRSYNFFDELDARLAELQDPGRTIR